MKIALIGYGKMGKTIEKIAIERGHTVVARASSSNPIESVDMDEAEVAIEFTAPHLAVGHIEYCVDHNIPIVVGTTAWNDKLPEVKDYVNRHNGSILYASNFSIGVNIFFDINRRLAKLMMDHSEYKASVDEIHHTEKLDAPSGTAVSIANDIMFENNNISSWIHFEDKTGEVKNDQLPVISHREKGVPGTHVVSYKSDIDEIELKHTALNRIGFGLGAVVAAEWLAGKKGIYTMQDVIKL